MPFIFGVKMQQPRRNHSGADHTREPFTDLSTPCVNASLRGHECVERITLARENASATKNVCKLRCARNPRCVAYGWSERSKRSAHVDARCTLLSACPDGRAGSCVDATCFRARQGTAAVVLEESPPTSLPTCLRAGVDREGAATHIIAAVWRESALFTGSAAAAAFDATPINPESSVLFLVHGHRQGEREYLNHARMLMRSAYQAEMRRAALLFVNNNVDTATETLVSWLRGPYPVGLRLLIRTPVNHGRRCGELHSIAGVAHVWRRFAWVLYVSGPDNLFSPLATRFLFARLAHHDAAGAQRRCAPAMLFDMFPHRPKRMKLSMDVFAFRVACMWPRPLLCASAAPCPPSRSWWDYASARCRSSSGVPERMLAACAEETSVEWRRLYLDAVVGGDEQNRSMVVPHIDKGWWHTHNSTLVEAYLNRMVGCDANLSSTSACPLPVAGAVGACCRRRSSEAQRHAQLRRLASHSPRACMQTCAGAPGCSTFSYSPSRRDCLLCRNCEGFEAKYQALVYRSWKLADVVGLTRWEELGIAHTDRSRLVY